jgi:hypothetical protein
MANLIQTPNSSMFSGYEYDDVAWILTLHLKNGKSYEYTDFGPEDYDEFVGAKSLGTHYNTVIKGKFESREVTGTPDPTPVKEQLKAAVADDALITDADIRRVDPSYQPKAEAPAPEILSPEQALAVMAPKNPKVDELTRRAHALAGKVLTVTNAATQADMESHLVQLATVRKALFELVDPYRAIAYAAYMQVQQINKSRLDPIDAAMESGKGVLKGYLQAEREKAAAEQRRLDAEARKRAEEDQARRTEQMRLEAAQAQAEAGDTEQAEITLFDQAIQAPPVYTPPVRVEMPTSSLGKKGGVRENWKGEVSNLEEVILDVAAGINASREGGGLRGHLPTTLITINPTILKQLASTNKAMASFPGLRFWDDGVIAVRTAKE